MNEETTTKVVPFGVTLMRRIDLAVPNPPKGNTKCQTGTPPRTSTDTDD
jgi:hypothetical protein